MARDIMTEQVQKAEVIAAIVPNKETAETASVRADQQHILAGALPAWDLVPRDQFIRRVK